MRFAASVVTLALLADTALCWDWPWNRKSAQDQQSPSPNQAMKCGNTIYTAADTMYCYERSHRLYFDPATDSPKTYPKLYTYVPEGDLTTSPPYIIFPMKNQEAWTEGSEVGDDRCFLDQYGTFLGVFRISSNPTRAYIEEHDDSTMWFAQCTEFQVNTDRKRRPAWHDKNIWETTGEIPA
ncbi:hypothetical protein BUE80_DR004739 [Diplocarpon rosae]|nr:hypothetical protein BUE80_DR004739 [Diplocarpon rosae]